MQRGKYQVVRKIDAGGMAEVYEGVAEGIQGFRKKVAIKRILPHLTENQQFITMFLDEARVSLHLSHANVVQVFDIGKSNETYFIVMEYIDGTNLKRLVETLNTNNLLLPVEQAVFVIMEVCRGLSYAHELKDADGKNLNIVHRDVSPPNILLSVQGEVKIVDFGLAKASSQIEATAAGVVKGKYAYLSPEYTLGKPVDRRMDVFGCGIVLWELLSGRRLFRGKNDAETIHNVRQAHVPDLPALNPYVNEELNHIVKTALSQNPDYRHQTCDALAEALANYLFNTQSKVTSFDLKRTLEPIVHGKTRNSREVEAQSIIDRFIQEELGEFASLENGGSSVRPPSPAPPDATSAPHQSAPQGTNKTHSLEQMLEGDPLPAASNDTDGINPLLTTIAVAAAVVTVILLIVWLLGIL